MLKFEIYSITKKYDSHLHLIIHVCYCGVDSVYYGSTTEPLVWKKNQEPKLITN